MNAKFLFHLVFLVISMSLSAQEITLALSQHPNKKAVLVAVHGIRKDTIGIIALDQNGKGTLAYKNKQPQAGLVNLTIKEKGLLSYDFVLSPNENPTLICSMEYVYAQNTKILNSPENDCLNRWFDSVVKYKQRISVNEELSKLYTAKIKFSKQLATEKKRVEKQLSKITDSINQSTLFAGKYMQFHKAQEEKLAKVWESNEQKTIAKNYFTQIDFDALYGSSMWFSIINTCMEAYTKESPYFETFGIDVVKNLKRIKNQQVYEDLLDAAISVTEKFSWNIDQKMIVDFIISDNKIKNPQGKLIKIIQGYKLNEGNLAPDLVITEHLGDPSNHNHKTTMIKPETLKSKYSLLLFYKSGCGPCEETIQSLKDNYKDLEAKGFRILSFAADTDTAVFNNTSFTLPWQDKFCDLEGVNGVNFKNYAVIGTPTMYVLDHKGKIQTKVATVQQLLEWLKKQ